MEYFKIETEEELRQAYSQLKWSPFYNLEMELSFFNENSLFRFIFKNKGGYHYLTKESYLSPNYVEIPNLLKNKNKMEYFKIETEEELRQAYSQLKWNPDYSLEVELDYFNEDSLYRFILKNKEGYCCLVTSADLYSEYVEIPNPCKKNTITNPIKDNRIVSDKTFALRFCGFLDDVSVSDACSEDELSYLKSVAKKLLTYQYQTATESAEVDYIKRLDDRFKKHLEKGLTTQDGYNFYRGDNVKLFSCMKQPQKSDDNTRMFHVNSILEGGINPNRVFFKDEVNKAKYIEDNLVQYSKKDLEQLIKNK